jgi:hypothetical protein
MYSYSSIHGLDEIQFNFSFSTQLQTQNKTRTHQIEIFNRYRIKISTDILKALYTPYINPAFTLS